MPCNPPSRGADAAFARAELPMPFPRRNSSPAVHSPVRPIVRAVHLAVAGLVAAAGGWSGDARAQANTTASTVPVVPVASGASGASQARPYDIPAGPLAGTLNRFAEEAGIFLTASGDLTSGKASPGLKGSYALPAAFGALLAGTGLQAIRQPDGTYSVRPFSSNASAGASAASAAAPASESSLPAVMVTADAERIGTTEGTQSYTTAATSTATKLDLSLRETPQSATVITRQRMDDQAMTSIVDVVRNTPGLFVSNSDGTGRPNFTARGFNANVMYEGFTSTWSSYIPTSQASLALFDRVEVVRGATGLAQGAGSPSAAINMVHKRPTREFQGSVSIDTGSWDDYGASADIGGPLNAAGTLRGRVVAAGQDTGTFRDGEKQKHGLFYGVLEADLGERTTLTVGAHRQTDYANHWWYDMPLSGLGSHLNLPRSTLIGNDWEYSKNRVTTAFATLEHGFGEDWKLRLATLQRWRDLDLLGSATYRRSSSDVGNNFYQSLWGGKYNYRDENYDASVAGPFSLLGRKHQVVAGVTHQSMESTSYGKKLTPSTIEGVNVFTWNPWLTTAPLEQFTGTPSASVVKQDSAYAAAHFELTDRWKLLLGGRLDWYEYENLSGSGSYKVDRNVTRYAGVTYDLDRNHTVYASYTDIFSPQTSKGIDGNILKPVVGENYEVGVKGEYLGGTLNASLAYFQIDQKNRSRVLDDQSACPSYPETSCSEATGLVRTKGIDLEVQGALTPQWQIGAGYTYSDTRYVRDATASRIGQRFSTATPQNMLKFSTMYRFSGEWSRWRVGGSVNWQSRAYNDGTTAGYAWRNQQGSYAVTEVVVGYRATPKLDIQLNVSNLFDKRYYQAIGYSTQWGTDVYGEPRKLKLTAKYTF
ncbi:TonB-dependent siderophore receptor [Variovorax sp. J22G73]|uniref:TonB-dependent siderophore receptor n=1 Tax=unclassified Variovorax TaxID=663243 RepID=UPI0025762048|nr:MULTISPECIES: TonB-dependent receptor [unclassified Variovorax]MDM0005756.1 TonB-dependent siderophore receptor [Variovorax sp. J22R203]MDM0099783.1 TonB-dependent siderophore receptor [Variovorax sp. J22G73]